MITTKDIESVKWMRNRLVYFHRYLPDDPYIESISNFISKLEKPSSIGSNQDDLDPIISKYFPEFYMEKDERWGLTQKEKDSFRKAIIGIIEDFNNFTKG